MLDAHNHYVQMYRSARERLHGSDVPNVRIHFFGDRGRPHDNWFSGPTASELAALIVGDLNPQCDRFDVIVQAMSGELEHILYLNPSLMPLQYPLLFDADTDRRPFKETFVANAQLATRICAFWHYPFIMEPSLHLVDNLFKPFSKL